MPDDSSPTLSGPADYPLWEVRVRGKLYNAQVWGVVDGTELASSSPAPPGTTPGPYTQTIASAPHHTWEARDMRARGVIMEHLSGDILLSVADCTTSKAMWDLIRDQHTSVNVAQQIFNSMSELYTLRWDTSTQISEHIGRIRTLSRQLASYGKPVQDDDLALILLMSLPREDISWKAFRSTVLNSAVTLKDQSTGLPVRGPTGAIRTTLDFASVAASVTGEVTLSTPKPAEESVQKSDAPQTSGNLGKHQCEYHGKNMSHDSTRCWMLHPELRKKKTRQKKKKGKANKAKSENSGSDSDPESGEETEHVHSVSAALKSRVYQYALSAATSANSGFPIIADSGCSSHMFYSRTVFDPKTFKVLNPPIKVRFGDDSTVEATGIGDVVLHSPDSNSDVRFERSLLLPTFRVNLISIGQLDKAGIATTFKSGQLSVTSGRSGKALFFGKLERKLYYVSLQRPRQFFAGAAIDINVLHRRMAHVSHDRLRTMVRNGDIAGVDSLTGTPDFCEPCVLGKMKKLPFEPGRTRAKKILQLVHADIAGPVTPQSREGYKYWLMLVDDFTGKPWVYFAKKKTEIGDLLKSWKSDVEAFFRTKLGDLTLSENWLEFLRSDNGTEFTNEQTSEWLRSLGIQHEKSAPYTPEQNGVAERMIQTTANLATTILAESGLPGMFWADAMATATYVTSRTPSASVGGRVPQTLLTGRRVNVKHFRPFGCPAYPIVPKKLRSGKFGWKARRCVMIGYPEGTKGFKLWDIDKKTIVVSRHVKFDESGKTRSDVLAEDRLRDPIPDNLRYVPVDAPVAPIAPPPPAPPPLDYADDASDDTPDVVEAPHDDVQLPEPEHDGSIKGEDDAPPPLPPPPAAQAPRGGERATPRPSRIPRSVQSTPATQGRGAAAPQQTPAPDPPPVQPQPATPRTLAPARRVAGMRVPDPPRKSARERKPATDGRAKYEEAASRPQQEKKGGSKRASFAFSDEDEDDIFFAGAAATGPSARTLPQNVHDMKSGPEAHLWTPALDEELENLRANDVYDVVPIPEGVKPVTSKVVNRVKFDSNGNVERYKCRIVARGFSQKPGVDYTDTFAPVASLVAVRIIVDLANREGLELDQMDVSTAYLNGELKEDIYLSPPEGVDIPAGHCWKLKRSIYGLKQAGRTWNITFDKKLGELGFARLDSETCLYVFRDSGTSEYCYLVVYVDDLLLAATSRKFMNKVKRMLGSAYKMRDLGEASYILGIKISRNRNSGTIELSQTQYIDEVLRRCGMADCKPARTPMSHSAKISKGDSEILHQQEINGVMVSYKSVVGSLMYAQQGTRADLSYIVGILGRYSAEPRECHWLLAKRTLRYLKYTRTLVLRYRKSSKNQSLSAYSDSDWSGDSDTSRSTSGYVFLMGKSAISWSSRRQKLVALSTTEAEYIALSNLGQELSWLRRFYAELGRKMRSPTTVFSDNAGAITLSREPQFRARTKHIQRKYHHFRDDLVRRKRARVEFCPTDDMVADIFTKPLGHVKHWRFVSEMGLRWA